MQDNFMKQDIEEAFLELSKTEAFDKITVTQIVKKCGISRQTFYYHFRDVMDVAENALIMLIETSETKAEQCKDNRKSITVFVECMQDSKKIFGNMYFSKYKDQLTTHMLLNLEKLLKGMPKENIEGKKLDIDKFYKYIDFYSYGLLGILIRRIVDADADTDEIANEIFEIINFNMKMFYRSI